MVFLKNVKILQLVWLIKNFVHLIDENYENVHLFLSSKIKKIHLIDINKVYIPFLPTSLCLSKDRLVNIKEKLTQYRIL